MTVPLTPSPFSPPRLEQTNIGPHPQFLTRAMSRCGREQTCRALFSKVMTSLAYTKVPRSARQRARNRLRRTDLRFGSNNRFAFSNFPFLPFTFRAPQDMRDIDWSCLQNLGKIGSGTFGTVLMMQDSRTKDVYAMKASHQKQKKQ